MLSPAHTWSLAAIAVASGVAMLWVFARFSNQERTRLAKRKVMAHLYAFRLFADDPALIFRAQKQLLIWNARYLAAMLRPAVIITLPAVLLFMQLDRAYGRRPLAPGETAIVSARTGAPAPVLEARGAQVETPALRVPVEGAVYWRIRATGGPIRVSVAGAKAELEYPPARLDIFGFPLHWLVWFFVVSGITMLALRKRFGVTF